jgi:hypothetical protein
MCVKTMLLSQAWCPPYRVLVWREIRSRYLRLPVDMVVSETTRDSSAYRAQPFVSHLSLAFASALCLALSIGYRIGSAAGKRDDAVLDVTGAGAARQPSGRTRCVSRNGTVKLTAAREKGMKRSKRSRCRDRVAPLVGCFGSEDPQRGA